MTDLSIGPLVAADETLHHQVVNTFGAVASTDVNWTEKIWANASARDGSLQIAFGLGKYLNRGVLDAYAGVCQGTTQWTVRGSRSLVLDAETISVGPLHYEVIEPLRSVRIVLEPNEIQPIAFDVVLHAAVPAGLEGREVIRAPGSSRITNDVVRYHQAGRAEGWVELDGERTPIDSSSWVSARDHSWGVRNSVGAPAKDLAPTKYPRNPQSFTSWAPITMTDPAGNDFVLFHYLMNSNFPGQPAVKLSGSIETIDGAVDPLVTAQWIDTSIDDHNRRFLHGTLATTSASGAHNTWRFEASERGTGFHLGTGLYFGFNGAYHGQWRGDLQIDGERVDNCDDRAVAQRIHQLRDCIVHVSGDDGSSGTGVMQTVVIGEFPKFSTTLANTFI